MSKKLNIALTLGFFLVSHCYTPIAGAFDQTYQRYLTGHDLFRTLRFHFPDAWQSNQGNRANISSNCQQITSQNKDLLGQVQPLTGRSATGTVNSAFIEWLTICLAQYIEADIPAYSPPESWESRSALSYIRENSRYFGTKFIGFLGDKKEDIKSLNQKDPRDYKWSDLSTDVQKEILQTRIKTLLMGNSSPAVLQHFENLLTKMTSEMSADVTIMGVLKQATFLVVASDEFLRY